MSKLVRDIEYPVGSRREPKWDLRRVGWRPDAVSDQECSHCWGTGRRLLYGRSLNCEEGIHGTCTGHQDPRRCGCWCHHAAAVEHGLTGEEANAPTH